MNRILRSKLSCIAVALLFPLVLLGCSTCKEGCLFLSVPCIMGGPMLWVVCLGACMSMCPQYQISSDCTDTPDECVAMFEQMQIAAIQFCEEYPDECQEAFDAWADAEE